MKLKNEAAFIFLFTIALFLSVCKAYVMGEEKYREQDHSQVTINNLQNANKDLQYINKSLNKQLDSLPQIEKDVMWIKQQGFDLKIVIPKNK